MKIRLISLLLLISMLTGMVVLPTSAVSADTTPTSQQCPCGCGAAFQDVQWKAWNVNEDAEVTSGHYYLDGDYAQAKQAKVTSGNRVVLDLRGHKLTTQSQSRLILCYGYMAVLDSVGGGRLCSKTTGAGYGGVVMIDTYETLNSVFELYSGTVTVDTGHKGNRRGGLIIVGDTCTFRMFGGTILNGTTYSTHEDYTETEDDAGGIYVESGASAEILGGSIIGCKADGYGGSIYSKGTTVLKNCSVIGGGAGTQGGNICQNGGTLTIENCTLSDGVSSGASGGGGNICAMSGAVLTIKNSTLRNGYSAGHGGNLYMGTVFCSIENTQIYGGVATMYTAPALLLR